MKNTSLHTAALILAAALLGAVLDRAWVNGIIPTASAQEGRAGAAAAAPKPMTPAEMQAEIEEELAARALLLQRSAIAYRVDGPHQPERQGQWRDRRSQVNLRRHRHEQPDDGA
jgi:hypothetical protein